MPKACAALAEFAPAKVNLTLHVVGRRADGYHEIESLVVFADVGDRLTLAPGDALELSVSGPTAAAAGADNDNLVLKAARLLAARVEGLKAGRFTLDKRLPVAAGVGGGSSDAAAALRLLARANVLALDDPRLHEAARLTGADVPVCLDPRARVMRGIGEILSAPLALQPLPAVLVNPGVSVPTKDVFVAFARRHPEVRGGEAAEPRRATAPSSFEGLASLGHLRMTALIEALGNSRNDLEAPAVTLQPVIADVLTALRSSAKCRLARMSGSGATCFGLFESAQDAGEAARLLAERNTGWWVRATTFGASPPPE